MRLSNSLTLALIALGTTGLLLAGCEREPYRPVDGGVDAGQTEDTLATCQDGVDNDADGLTDCADPGCQALTVCTETACANGVDDDGDGATDCADTDCQGTTACSENTAAACQNEIDDDGDGDTDCADTGCQDFAFCEPHETECEDGEDNDGDGNADCADEDCQPLPVCGGFCYPVGFVSPALWGMAITEANDDEDAGTECVQYTVRVQATAPVADTQVCLYLDSAANLVGCADPTAGNPVEFAAVTFCQGNHSLFAQVRQGGVGCTSERIDLVAYQNPTCEITHPAGLSTVAGSPTAVSQAVSDLAVTTTGARAEVWVSGQFLGSRDASDLIATFPAVTFGAGTVSLLARCYNPGVGNGQLDSPTHYLTVDASSAEDTEVLCADGEDNDGDGLTDCADPQCQGFDLCAESNCENGLDDDNDGLIDCLDPNCQGTLACRENNATTCQNGIDDDGDGRLDCADPECQGFLFCVPKETDCGNGTDDDGDGATDCADSDCAALPECGGFCYSIDFVTPSTWGAAITEQNHDEDAGAACIQYTVRVQATAPGAGTQICLYLDSLSNQIACADPTASNPVEFPAVSFCQGNHSLFAQVTQGGFTCATKRIDLVAYLDPTCAVSLPVGLSTDPGAPTLMNVAATDFQVATSGARAELWVNGGYMGSFAASSGVVSFPATPLGIDGPVSILARCHNAGTGNGQADTPTYRISKDTVAPNLAITSPADGVSYGAAQCPFTVTVTGVDAGREVCASYHGQAPLPAGCATATGPTQSVPLQVACVDGHDLPVEATTSDAHGNSAMDTVLVSADTGVPAVIIQSLESGKIYNQADDTLNPATTAFEHELIACTDWSYNPGRVSLTVDGVPVTSITPIIEAALCNGLPYRIRWSAPYAFSQSVSGLQTSHTVVVAIDDGLNVGSATLSFKNDTMPPVLNLACASCLPNSMFLLASQDTCPGAPFEARVRGEVTGLEVGRDVTLSVKSQGVPIGASPYTKASTSTGIQNPEFGTACGVELTIGQNMLKLTATDAAGNAAESTGRHVAQGDAVISVPFQEAMLSLSDDCDAGADYGITMTALFDKTRIPDGSQAYAVVSSAAGAWSYQTSTWTSNCSVQTGVCTYSWCQSIPVGVVEQNDIAVDLFVDGVVKSGGPRSVLVDNSPPPPPTSLARTITNRRAAEVELTWQDSVDPQTGVLLEWDVRCAVDSTLTDANWASAMVFSREPVPGALGTARVMRIAETPLRQKIRMGHSYSCGLRGRNAVGLWSPLALFSEVTETEVGLIEYPVSIEGYTRANLGSSVWPTLAAAGDVNGDGYDDLLIGYGKSGLGKASALFLGGADGVNLTRKVEMTCADSSFGTAMVGIGDFDGAVYDPGIDPFTYPDFAVSARDEDTVYIFRGHATLGASGTLDCAEADFVIQGPTGSAFGNVLAAGDVDGDGLRDLIVGAYRYLSNFGASYAVFGRGGGTFPQVINLESGANAFGTIMVARASAGYAGSGILAADLDLDGKDEIVFSSPIDTAGGYGEFAVFGGRDVPKDANLMNVYAYADVDQVVDFPNLAALAPAFGLPSILAVDFNLDGCLDIVVGVSRTNLAGTGQASGSIVVFPGQRTGNTCTGVIQSSFSQHLSGGALGDQLGRSTATVNNTTLAGSPPWRINGLAASPSDVAVWAGARQENVNTSANTGPGYSALWFAGATGNLGIAQADLVFVAPAGAISYQWVALVGDLNGDGYVDFAQGDPDFGAGGRVNLFY